jgi:MauM/NapG family ferredoxin protein
MRTYVQGISLLLFSVFFILAAYRLPGWFPADIYLRLDPLLGLTSIIAGREIISRVLWSLVIVGATLLIGRFFCAYICPMGAAIDFFDLVLFTKKNRLGLQKEKRLRKIKYYLLFIFLGSSVAGISLSHLLDPLPFLTRFYTFFLYPFGIAIINFLADILRPLFKAFGWVQLSHLYYVQPVFYMSIFTLLVFLGVMALNLFAPRFWCRYLCPLGALLSFFSPFGFFNRKVSAACNECMKCQKTCPMGAVGDDPRVTVLPECIQCRTCSDICPKKAIAFNSSPTRDRFANSGGEYSLPVFSRRKFLFSMSGGFAISLLAEQSPLTSLQGKKQMIRPPGAIPESAFLRTCIRCGECMKSCLTNTLQPSLWESGLAGLWTPQMVLRLAPCEQTCNVCGQVCPTQAIRSVSLEEKNHAKIGTAVLLKEKCVVWAEDKLCLICDEICPYNAIVFRTVDGIRRPFVISSRCNGCGFCEQRCPVLGDSAIVVIPNGEIRLKDGSYIEEAKKLHLEFKPDPGDDQFILENPEEGNKEGGAGNKPKGFL